MPSKLINNNDIVFFNEWFLSKLWTKVGKTSDGLT
jgi:hypothetical protein